MSIILEKTRAELSRLSLDYPRQGERIESPFYTVRVTAPQGAQSVEVSIDGSEWQACREAVGHYWFDWSGYAAGDHEITARITLPGGRYLTAEPHAVRVETGASFRIKAARYN